jgi:methionine sulfoxide reductase heme-binding subunit
MNDLLTIGARSIALVAVGSLAMVLGYTWLASTPGYELPAMWWAVRAFGLLAYVAAWLSTLFGVLVAAPGSKSWLDRATALELHGRWSVATLVTTAVHVLLVVGDAHSGVTPLVLLSPLASAKLTGPIALGTFATWGLAVLALSTAAYRKLPRWGWRALHATAFGTFLLALAHGVVAGTDTQSPVVSGAYALTTAVLLVAMAYRITHAVVAAKETLHAP